MRLYEYKCEDCKYIFEEMNSEANRHTMDCKLCGSSKTALQLCAARAQIFEFKTSDIDGVERTYHSKSELAEACVKRWTPTNKPWPEILDGFNGPGVPNDVKCDGAEGYPTKEELCQAKTKKLQEQAEVARERERKGTVRIVELPSNQ